MNKGTEEQWAQMNSGHRVLMLFRKEFPMLSPEWKTNLIGGSLLFSTVSVALLVQKYQVSEHCFPCIAEDK